MRVKYLPINLVLLMYLCVISNHNLFSAVKSNDPITDSYIINNLQMESDKAPSISDQESVEGEIIFDDSFDDNFSKKPKPSISINSKEKIKKMLGSDKRLHLTEYRIRHNENLWTIAKRSNTSLKLLKEINNIKNPSLLKENDQILIPSKKGIYYKIRKGDTLTGISQKFNAEIDKIAEHNNIDGRKIIAGRKIFLPEAEEPVKKEIPVINKHHTNIDNTEKIAVSEKSKEKKSVSGTKVVLSWPLRGPITSAFGMRTHPLSGEERFHCGMDIGAEVGTPIRAAGEGTVIYSGWKDTYGNLIVISHKNNYLTIYAHNSKIFVNVNEKIKKGQKISLSGKTGAVTGAHLHFEIRKGIVPLDPVRILK